MDRYHDANAPKPPLDTDQVSNLTRESLFQRLPVKLHPVVFFGDSQTANGEWAEFFPGSLNRGIGGDTSAGLLDRVQTITKLQPKAVFLLIGANDFARGVTPQQTAANIATTVSTIRRLSPSTLIYLETLTPTWQTSRNRFAKQVNQLIQPLADGKSIFFLDFYDSFLRGDILDPSYSYDGGHLNGLGFLVWKRLLDPYAARLTAANLTPAQHKDASNKAR